MGPVEVCGCSEVVLGVGLGPTATLVHDHGLVHHLPLQVRYEYVEVGNSGSLPNTESLVPGRDPQNLHGVVIDVQATESQR